MRNDVGVAVPDENPFAGECHAAEHQHTTLDVDIGETMDAETLPHTHLHDHTSP